jgi:hypothetical protein
MAKKERVEIPKDVAARVLFLADRTCCVCRQEGKPVQIHHLDDDPSNNALPNLSVLCFDCHRETQIRGGFDRKLDADQVLLFRNDWYALVSQRRAGASQHSRLSAESSEMALAVSTSVAEIYRENKEYELLAIHYNAIGNRELRDKYVDLALRGKPTDGTICFLRGLQDRANLIPPAVLKRQLKFYANYDNFTQRARLLADVGEFREAATDYVRGILSSLEEGNVFPAAFYIKELAEQGVLDELFILALKEAKAKKDLWWQVRALQELEWNDELKTLLIENRREIEASDNPELQRLLAEAMGDQNRVFELKKEIARRQRSYGEGIALLPPEDKAEKEDHD